MRLDSIMDYFLHNKKIVKASDEMINGEFLAFTKYILGRFGSSLEK